jgi:hypothetical protein
MKLATGTCLTSIGPYHTLDYFTNKLLCFLTNNIFCKEKKALAFNWNRRCHLVFCLYLILFNWRRIGFKNVCQGNTN